ncbi:MAG TPA: hypothetical protein VNX65_02280 [Patescibacteria group bacterium]|jgi:hypothetical protein|nr:hypothetical protein [Patescibacteria group bacterium]
MSSWSRWEPGNWILLAVLIFVACLSIFWIGWVATHPITPLQNAKDTYSRSCDDAAVNVGSDNPRDWTCGGRP